MYLAVGFPAVESITQNIFFTTQGFLSYVGFWITVPSLRDGDGWNGVIMIGQQKLETAN
jgi:hypothetical protein